MGRILIANPGSSSRKYAVYSDKLEEIARLHFEYKDEKIVCSLIRGEEISPVNVECSTLNDTASCLPEILQSENIIVGDQAIETIGIRVVAPGSFFTKDHIVDDSVVSQLTAAEALAPLHIRATLAELHSLRASYPGTTIVGVSDSAFHLKKPGYAWNYGINIQDADKFEVKRYGYHGISVAASVAALWNAGKLPPKVVVCHLGSGSSITGVFHGRTIDTTMGFTPNEGVIMATRSGTVSVDAGRELKKQLGVDDAGLDEYLNTKGGLEGIGASNDIRELLEREADGDHMAHLALTTLIHTIHKAIGSMIVAMNGCDLVVFTGTVGERSAILRKRIVAHLEFLDFIIDGDTNEATTAPTKLTFISQSAKSRPIVVIPTDESKEIAKHTLSLLNKTE